MKPIKDDTFLIGVDKAFHNHCFRCALCKNALSLNDYIIVDRIPYCKSDCIPLDNKLNIDSEGGLFTETTFSSRISKQCSKCKKSIVNTNYIIILNLPYHRDCLKCGCCDRYLTIADLVILNMSKQTFCRYPCFQRKILFSKAS